MSEEERKPRPRTAAIALRCPWLYAAPGEKAPKPGDSALLDATQLRAVRRAIRDARAEGRLSVKAAQIEMKAVQDGLAIIEKGPLRDVGAFFPVGECIEPRQNRGAVRHRRNKAARQARKVQRQKKKGRR